MTLVELLVVMLLILLFAAAVVGIAGYAARKTKTSRAQAEVALLEAVIEGFKADTGRYPTSSIWRSLVNNTFFEAINSSLLGQQLVNGGYLPASGEGLLITNLAINDYLNPFCSNAVGGGWVYPLTNLWHTIIDPWNLPYGYYCTYPRITPVSASADETYFIGSCTWPSVGGSPPVTNINSSTLTNKVYQGQINLHYDLWCRGPDLQIDNGQDDDISNIK
ncbi:hypothetical protein HQ590_00085 [bacterium]|nr:hypothetical protein [bacterium]